MRMPAPASSMRGPSSSRRFTRNFARSRTALCAVVARSSPSARRPCCTRPISRSPARERVEFPDRARFMAYASRAMRRLIIDFVRERRALKRGAEFEITVDADARPPEPAVDARELERISEALDALAASMPRWRSWSTSILLRLLVRRDRRDARASPSARCSATGTRRACSCTTHCGSREGPIRQGALGAR